MKKIFVTGAAGFIGYSVAKVMLERGDEVVGIDNLSDYYDVNLKKARLKILSAFPNFTFHALDITDKENLFALFKTSAFDEGIHLAAQAGVRYSLINPQSYLDSNIIGFGNILEACRAYPVAHLVYASSSSVYGGNTKMPFSEEDPVAHPVSLYAATKRANELMAHSYAHLFHLPSTGLRFFTVYGPWGRPDMALFDFTKKILSGESITVFNHGNMKRDFTYIDDIVAGVLAVLEKPPVANPNWKDDSVSTSFAPCRVLNIGNHHPVDLIDFIEAIEEATGKKAKMEMAPMQPGDVPATYADISRLKQLTGFTPKTAVKTGVEAFVNWYRTFYKV